MNDTLIREAVDALAGHAGLDVVEYKPGLRAAFEPVLRALVDAAIRADREATAAVKQPTHFGTAAAIEERYETMLGRVREHAEKTGDLRSIVRFVDKPTVPQWERALTGVVDAWFRADAARTRICRTIAESLGTEHVAEEAPPPYSNRTHTVPASPKVAAMPFETPAEVKLALLQSLAWYTHALDTARNDATEIGKRVSAAEDEREKAAAALASMSIAVLALLRVPLPEDRTGVGVATAAVDAMAAVTERGFVASHGTVPRVVIWPDGSIGVEAKRAPRSAIEVGCPTEHIYVSLGHVTKIRMPLAVEPARSGTRLVFDVDDPDGAYTVVAHTYEETMELLVQVQRFGTRYARGTPVT